MSRLVNYTLGDICDRLTVLALKIHHYTVAGRKVDHLVNERSVLLTQWTGRNPTGQWFAALLELGVVNAALWQETDSLRELDDTPPDPSRLNAAGCIALRILALNDRRAQLVELIDKTSGDHKGSEKGQD